MQKGEWAQGYSWRAAVERSEWWNEEGASEKISGIFRTLNLQDWTGRGRSSDIDRYRAIKNYF